MIPIKYYHKLDDFGFSAITFTAHWRGNLDQSWHWTIEDWHDPGAVFSKSRRKFIDEPLPINRNEEHTLDTRFDSYEEALAFWNKGKS